MSTKEEQKQHLIDIMNRETLEEAAERYVENFAMSVKTDREIGFIDGAKWMEHRMYSELEVYNIIEKLFDNYASDKTDKAIDDFDENLKKQ